MNGSQQEESIGQGYLMVQRVIAIASGPYHSHKHYCSSDHK